MKKKITKTISLIVFVVFIQLFMQNVYAVTGKENVALTCVYDAPKKETVILNITNNGSIMKNEESTFGGSIRNNGSKDYEEFDGREYFNKNKECPPYAVYNKELWFSGDDVILAGSKNMADEIASDIISGTVMKLKDSYVNENANQNIKNQNNTPATKNLNLPKKCVCEADKNQKKYWFEFQVNKSLSNPDITIYYTGDDDTQSVTNWSAPGADGEYTYLDDLSKNDSCPDYAIYGVATWDNEIYFSDSAHMSKIYQTLIDKNEFKEEKMVLLNCSNKNKNSNSNSNSNSNKNSNSNSNVKSNSNSSANPDVNSNVVRILDYDVSTYSCGNRFMTGIPAKVPRLCKFIMNFIQILIPIVLIILGSLDLIKAVYASKEDEIKKSQQIFVKRLISAIIVFFVFAIVKLVVSVVATNNSRIMECVDCILRNSDSCEEEK